MSHKNKIETNTANETYSDKTTWMFPKLLSLGIISCIFVALQLAYIAAKQDPFSMSWPGNHYILENTSIGFMAASAVFALLLIGYYNSAYSIFWAKAIEQKLDERQRAVRNRVFLYAYRAFLVMVILASSDRQHYDRVDSYIVYSMIILAAALPSMFASWHKNAR